MRTQSWVFLWNLVPDFCDPFDRVMASQALERDLAIVSFDDAFDA